MDDSTENGRHGIETSEYRSFIGERWLGSQNQRRMLTLSVWHSAEGTSETVDSFVLLQSIVILNSTAMLIRRMSITQWHPCYDMMHLFSTPRILPFDQLTLIAMGHSKIDLRA